jgi:hypothetical protein
MKKKCNKCKEVKPVSEFGKEARAKNGYKPRCKKCTNAYYNSMYPKLRDNKLSQLKEYHHTKAGLIKVIYGSQLASSKDRCHNPPEYTMKELKDWMFSQKVFHELFNRWKNSGFDKALVPSCDRLDDYLGYSFSNLRIVTWDENNKKGYSDVCNGVNNKRSKAVICTDKITGNKIEFYSINEASRKLNIAQSRISSCCLHRYGYKSAGGYTWEFKN